MKARTLLLPAILVAMALPIVGQAAERAKAKVDCKPTDEKLVYDCMIMLMGKKTGNPVDGAKVVVGTDMPSMPMAHNVRPVNAMPMGKPGMYYAKLHLEMHGEWTLTMDVSGPIRDKIIHNMHFGSHAGGQAGMKHEHREMKHKGMKHGEDKKE